MAYLNVGELKKMLKGVPNDTEVFIRCTFNPVGNIVEAGNAAKSEYSFFGTSIPCIIIEPCDEEE